MKRVCLIIPPSVFLLDERVFMSLGILRIAAVLERSGHPVEMLDLSGVQNYLDAVALHARSTDAEIFGVTSTTPQMPATFEIANTIRQVRPNARLVLGGPHITLVRVAQKRELERNAPGRATAAYDKLAGLFDVLVAGDGEKAIFAAIGDDAPSLIDADDPKSPLFLTTSKLNELPFPARHLLDVDSYRYSIDGVGALSIIAQLGCPFACGFCGGRESPMLRRVRMRSSENVVAEVLHLNEAYRVRGFMLYDDELNVSPGMIELMSLLRCAQEKLGIEFRFRGFIKAELFNDRQAEALYQAGFRWILTGFESGSPRILKNINKRATRQDNSRCVEIARRHGLKVKALMSIGHPGESEETVMDTHQWLAETRPDDFDVTIITSYPGTPYYDHAVRDTERPNVWVYTVAETQDKLHAYEVDYTKEADYYKGNPDGGYRSYVYTDHLTAERLVGLRDFVERDIRTKLGIPFNSSRASMWFEHSMGQLGAGLPSTILRTTGGRDGTAPRETA